MDYYDNQAVMRTNSPGAFKGSPIDGEMMSNPNGRFRQQSGGLGIWGKPPSNITPVNTLPEMSLGDDHSSAHHHHHGAPIMPHHGHNIREIPPPMREIHELESNHSYGGISSSHNSNNPHHRDSSITSSSRDNRIEHTHTSSLGGHSGITGNHMEVASGSSGSFNYNRGDFNPDLDRGHTGFTEFDRALASKPEQDYTGSWQHKLASENSRSMGYNYGPGSNNSDWQNGTWKNE